MTDIQTRYIHIYIYIYTNTSPTRVLSIKFVAVQETKGKSGNERKKERKIFVIVRVTSTTGENARSFVPCSVYLGCNLIIAAAV